ncbi:hypothetical protein X743_14400 [Mesorhizobium sp. LNHC252B00]|nr:hypothetical protein X743_14400 [Mesorhizobium sp. LNHC252B00]
MKLLLPISGTDAAEIEHRKAKLDAIMADVEQVSRRLAWDALLRRSCHWPSGPELC